MSYNGEEETGKEGLIMKTIKEVEFYPIQMIKGDIMKFCLDREDGTPLIYHTYYAKTDELINYVQIDQNNLKTIKWIVSYKEVDLDKSIR